MLPRAAREQDVITRGLTITLPRTINIRSAERTRIARGKTDSCSKDSRLGRTKRWWVAMFCV